MDLKGSRLVTSQRSGRSVLMSIHKDCVASLDSGSRGSPATLGVGSPMRGAGSTVLRPTGGVQGATIARAHLVPICRRSPLAPGWAPRSIMNNRWRLPASRDVCRRAVAVHSAVSLRRAGPNHHVPAFCGAVAPLRRNAGVLYEDGGDPGLAATSCHFAGRREQAHGPSMSRSTRR